MASMDHEKLLANWDEIVAGCRELCRRAGDGMRYGSVVMYQSEAEIVIAIDALIRELLNDRATN